MQVSMSIMKIIIKIMFYNKTVIKKGEYNYERFK